MSKFLICEIGGKQVKIEPKKAVTVAFMGDVKKIKAKVLVKADEKGVIFGNPYLKEEIELDVIGTGKDKKVRVGKFHAKANYRRVRGHRNKISTVVLNP